MRDAAHEGRHGQRDEAIVTLLYDTGLRRSELSGVDRAMLDLAERELRIPPEIQKDYPNENTPKRATFELDRGGDLRTVRTLRAFLNTREDRKKALFPSGGVEPYAYAGRGDPTDVTAHTLRHSVAWRMLRAEEGNTLYDVRNRLRHATIITTERKYDHFQTI